jgi:hypothetical protein
VLSRYLPDVRADGVMMACEACCGRRIKYQQDMVIGDYRVTTVQHWVAGHSPGTATLPGCPTAWSHTVLGHDVAR